MKQKRFYNEKEAAKWFGVKVATIARWRKTRLLAHCRTKSTPDMLTKKTRVPGEILFDIKDLNARGDAFERFPAKGG